MSTILCAVGALAAPSMKQEKRGLSVSQDASCGASSGNTCLGSFFGDCCSEAGQCGQANSFCGQGCQSGYGSCTGIVNGLAISNDGTCGNGVTCQGSEWGDCCSGNGFWYVWTAMSDGNRTYCRTVDRQVTTVPLVATQLLASALLQPLLHHLRLHNTLTLLQLLAFLLHLLRTQLVPPQMVRSILRLV